MPAVHQALLEGKILAYAAFLVGKIPGAFARRSYDTSVKRLFDVAVTLVLLAFISPLFLLLFVAIRLDGGPCLFRHDRVGFGGKTFKCLKFRTMVPDSAAALERHFAVNPYAQIEWTETHKLRNDPRITRVGAFLRKSSLDEVPQLLNVLMNDMSLVGPRPITASETSRYGSALAVYLSVLPGITGLWQVSGRSKTTYEKRIQLDVDYVSNRSFGKDISILLRTIPAVLLRGGAY